MSEESRVDALVSTLRPELREHVASALAYTRTLREPRGPVEYRTEQERWGAALKEAGLAAELDGSWSDRRIRPASELSVEQRTLAEILARTPGPNLTQTPMPAAAWVRRQWLGIDPPGPLFRVQVGGEPLYFAARAARRDGNPVLARLLAALPDAERTAALCDLRLIALDCWSSPAEGMLQGRLPDLGPAAGPWATSFADRLLALFAPHQPAAERGNLNGIPIDLSRAAFLSLVRAEVPLEPRWDALLPLAPWIPAAERTRCLRALPAERREAAVATALGRIFFTNHRVALALELLAGFPLASAAACVVENIASAPEVERARAVLRAAAERSAAVAAVVQPLDAKLARTPRLRAAKRIDPIERKDLDALRAKQLEAANKKYGGKKLTVDQLFALEGEGEEAGEVIMPSLCELVLIEDEKGTPTHDAWMYMGDSGTIFAAGTTKVVAEIIQGGLECKRLPLKLALQDALARKPPKAKKATSKKGAKKAATPAKAKRAGTSQRARKKR
jgi:hypothetical protein